MSPGCDSKRFAQPSDTFLSILFTFLLVNCWLATARGAGRQNSKMALRIPARWCPDLGQPPYLEWVGGTEKMMGSRLCDSVTFAQGEGTL